MKRISILVVLMLLATSSCFAWTKVVQMDLGHFSVNEDSIKHYAAKGGFNATEGVYNYYDYQAKTEISYVVKIRDDDLSYITVNTCYWVEGKKTSCNAVTNFHQTSRGTNGEAIIQWMVDYRKLTRGDDVM